MTRFFAALVCALVCGCSAPFSSPMFGLAGAAGETTAGTAGAASAAAAGDAGTGGAGTGGLAGGAARGGDAGTGDAGTGGVVAAGAPGTGGSPVTGGTGGTPTGGSAGATGGTPATGGSPATGGTGATGPGWHDVDVVPGIQTDCVFPSRVFIPPFVPVDCQDQQRGSSCFSCAGDCVMNLQYGSLVWDYSLLQLVLYLTPNGTLYPMNQGACGSEVSCDYSVYKLNADYIQIKMLKTDRGYVPNNLYNLQVAPSTESCSSDPEMLGFTATCIQSSWTKYWAAITFECA